ncbi:hypothetical protein MMC30_007935 [Trapelia coarctata]|nr:hypothetical protein [Trapelia coarctata]
MELSPFDQLPFFLTYSEILLLFPLSQDVEASKVIANLELGVQALKKHFPFLAGQVIIEKDKACPEPNTGTVRIVSYDGEPMLRVKHLPKPFSSYDTIRRSKAPASMLDGTILAPMKGLPERYDGTTPTPVLIVQANFASGGLIICFAAMHSAMDANGLGQVIRLFAAACNGEELPEAAIQAGNLDRTKLIPILPSDQPALEHAELRRIPNDNTNPHSQPAISAPWTYYRLPHAVLAKLKAEVTQECLKHGDKTWVSTNDVACALIWRAILAARSSRLKDDEEVNLLRAVNGRRYLTLPIPQGYFGNVVVGAATTLSLRDLIQDLSHSTITIRIRESLKSISDFHIRSVATLIRGEPDLRTISFEPQYPERDMVISSWAALPIYPSDFGPLLGKPEFVRRPTMTPCDGLVYIMPKTPGGDLDVAMSLREGDTKGVKNDEVWRGYAELIG